MVMTERGAAERLKRMYESAPYGSKVTSIHLFAIKHAEDLAKLDVGTIVKVAGVPVSYVTEVHKGMRLAMHVTLKPGV